MSASILADPTDGLANSVFSAQSRSIEGRNLSTTEGIVEKLKVYKFDPRTSDEDKLKVLAFMTCHGRSEDSRPSSWHTWALSYIVCAFPEMEAKINSQNAREYEFKVLPKEYISSIVEYCNVCEESTESDAGNILSNRASQLSLVKAFPELEPTPEVFAPELAASQRVEVVYGYVGLLIFLAGKKINEKNAVSITERRPQNLCDTFDIDETEAYCLTGDGKMNSVAHKQVNQMWTTYAGARVGVIEEVATFASPVSKAQRVVYTITKLLEFSGMQPAYFIHRFLSAFPEAATFSCIRPALVVYIQSVREVASAPAHLQPYYKLIKGDTTRVFHRNSILTLASCAICYEKYTAPSMKNFRLGEGASAALALYDAEAVRKGYTTLQSLTFAAEHDNSAD